MTVRIDRDGDVALWTLARPHAKNALDAATFAALERAIASVPSDRTLRAIVLSGEGDTFASGGDLRELRAATTLEDAGRLADVGRRVCGGLSTLDVPVIAALPGAAIGGGAELALACDLRIADPRASICFKHARMGVTTAWGILPRLVAVAGLGGASRLLLTSQTLGAAECLRLGLVDAVSQEGAAVDLAMQWAHDAAEGAPGAVAAMKALLPTGARERERFVAAWTSDDHREAVEAFFEGRPPRWR